MYKVTFINKQIKKMVCFRRNREVFRGCFVSCFTDMFFNRGRTIKFDILSEFINFSVLSTANQKVMEYFP